MRLGGDKIGVCRQSMIIPETISDWEDRTGLGFPGSGRYIAPFALKPIDVDLERDRGVYVGPNVGVVHRAST